MLTGPDRLSDVCLPSRGRRSESRPHVCNIGKSYAMLEYSVVPKSLTFGRLASSMPYAITRRSSATVSALPSPEEWLCREPVCFAP